VIPLAWIEMIVSRSGLASMLSGLLEGMGIPWPGAVVLTAAGTEATDATGAVVLALCFGVLYTGASWLQYMVGRYCWSFLQRYIPAAQQAKLQAVMEKHGEFAVLWTRPLAIGNYVSLPAGMIGMHQGKFLLYTFAGIMPWCLAMTFGGSWIGAHLSAATDILTVAAAAMAVVGILVAVRKAARTRKVGQAAQPQESEAAL
jgi:membrane protein DedA with SNARE-associated domain